MVENRRVGIKSRETYECPASLALILAHKDLESICLERDLDREKARIEPRYAELIYDGLWFSPLKQAFDAFVESSQRSSPARCGCASSPGCCVVTGRRSHAQPLRLRPRHLRRGRRVPPRGLGRLRAAVGPRHRDLGGSPRLEARVGRRPQHRSMIRCEPAPGDDALARPVRVRPGRRAAGVHGQPAVRPAARARRHRRVAGRTSAGWCGPGSSTATRPPRPRRARPGRGGAAPTGRSRSARPTRTSTPRSSGGSPSWPAPAGAKLHTGRSRNDQVATDLRLYTQARRCADVAAGCSTLQQRAARSGRGRRRRLPARLHAPAAGPAGAAGPPPAGPRLGARARPRPPARRPVAGRRLAARRRGAGRLVARRSTPRASPPTSGSPRRSTTRSTP